jgi:hypothetical protein
LLAKAWLIPVVGLFRRLLLDVEREVHVEQVRRVEPERRFGDITGRA